jgi:hypothetical protein
VCGLYNDLYRRGSGKTLLLFPLANKESRTMTKIMAAILVWCAVAAAVYAGEASDIVMDDGSVIRAEIMALLNGNYTIHSSSIGTLTIDAARVRRISRPGDTAVPLSGQNAHSGQAPVSISAGVENAKEMILNDPEAMRSVTELAADPAFKALVADPQIMSALNSGDTATLMQNPKFRALTDNPKMQGVATRLMEKSKE